MPAAPNHLRPPDALPAAPNPPVEQIELWLVSPPELDDAALADAYTLLLPDERDKHKKFVFERHRREYLATRGLVRSALSRHRAAPRTAWAFRRNEYGRPELEPAIGLRFNLSNHPSLVVCAVRDAGPAAGPDAGPGFGDRLDPRREPGLDLGCDIEPLERGEEVLGIAESVFAPRELAELRALPAALQPERAISLWTLKEAYIKARSIGLTLPLQEFAFSFPEGGAPRITFTSQISDTPARWRFAMLDLAGCRVALALECDLDLPTPPISVRAQKLSAFDEKAPVMTVAQVTLPGDP